MTRTPLSVSPSAKRRALDTDDYSARLREALVDTTTRSIQLTDFSRSKQGADLSTPANFGGFGRVHHFDTDEGVDWPPNPLPIAPALRALGLAAAANLDAQVFQSAGCNWRCWYCYVPFADLTARQGRLTSVPAMVDQLETSRGRIQVVDLTGGQPDLTPEWPVWVLDELDRRGVDDIYVWSDDNLSTDYFWRYLSSKDRGLLSEHPRYGRACCLKGIDPESFRFNTKADPSLYEQQFQLLKRLHDQTAIDYYLYVTFTTPNVGTIRSTVSQFVDSLQEVSESLPLRTVPLRILEWGPVADRLDDGRLRALDNQMAVVDAWLTELDRRFGSPTPPFNICDVPR